MIAIMLDIKCCGSGASRLLVDDSSRQHSNGVRFILPRAHSRITTTERALLQQCWIWYAKPVNIQCSYLLRATFRVAYGNDITGLFAAPVRDLLRRHARCYPLKRALSSNRLCAQERRSITMLSLVGAHY
nr:MAG TPA: hypothetical protein [Caudoviricetes sp.]